MKTYEGISNVLYGVYSNARYCNILSLFENGYGMLINQHLIDQCPHYLEPIVKDGKIGFINSQAEIVIKPEFNRVIGSFDDNDSCVAVTIKEGDHEKWGIIDTNGRKILPLVYKHAFVHKKRFLGYESDEGATMIDKETGTITIPFGKYSQLRNYGYEKYGYIDAECPYERENKKVHFRHFLIDEHDHMIIPYECHSIKHISDQLIRFSVYKKGIGLFFIPTNEVIMKPKFVKIDYTRYGSFYVQTTSEDKPQRFKSLDDLLKTIG